NTELIVGGDFRNAGAVTVNHVARWNGASWGAMGEGFNGLVEGLCEYQGSVIACGGFTASGMTTVNRIARWSGTFWEPIGSGFPSGAIMDVEVFQGVLVAGGYLTNPDDTWRPYAAYWNGQTWQSLGTLGGSRVRAMHALGNSLFLGGEFTSVD